jgi:hypothetical protein
MCGAPFGLLEHTHIHKCIYIYTHTHIRTIQADFRDRIRTQTHGLPPAAARSVSDALQAQRDK